MPPRSSMRQVTLPGTGVILSRVGFGSSGLMARLTRQQSLRLLSVAYDCGITHFDTARSYGYGESESVIGKFIAGKRDRVTITSKAGILPPRSWSLLSIAKEVARWAVKVYPPARAQLRRRAERLMLSGVFEIPMLQRSLETSLHELGTDYLDIFLLHDCSAADLERPELLEFLERNRRAGKIRYHGVASTPEVCSITQRRWPGNVQVVQFANNAINRAIEQVVLPGSAVGTITHSPLGAAFNLICERLASDDAMAGAWSGVLQFNVRDRQALGTVFLSYALSANPQGCVLFSSNSDANIRLNALTAASVTDNAERVSSLLSCLQSEAEQ